MTTTECRNLSERLLMLCGYEQAAETFRETDRSYEVWTFWRKGDHKLNPKTPTGLLSLDDLFRLAEEAGLYPSVTRIYTGSWSVVLYDDRNNEHVSPRVPRDLLPLTLTRLLVEAMGGGE